MTTLQYIVGSVLILASLFLVVVILLQEGKSKSLGGAIAGGADTFLGKKKGKQASDKLSKVTTVVAICFTLIVLVMYLFQDNLADVRDIDDEDTREQQQTETDDDDEADDDTDTDADKDDDTDTDTDTDADTDTDSDKDAE